MINDVGVLIALRKGVRSYTSHSIRNFVNYDSFSPTCKAFITSFDSVHVLRTIHKALKHPRRWKVVHDKVIELQKNGTWLIIDLLARKRLIGCMWIFTIKHKVDGSIERLKA